jgi:uncharacterized RDD family membrane protein YckC
MSVVPVPPQASEPLSPVPAGGGDLLGLRIGAALIDLALLFGLFVVLSAAIGEASVRDGFSFSLNGIVDAALYVGLVLVYYFALEATIGQTVGKLLTGLRVVSADGDRPSVGAVAIRTVVRVVDWLPLLYLVGFLTMLATGVRRQRLGDLAAGTGITRAAPIRHRAAVGALVASTLGLVLAGSVVYVAVVEEEAKTCHGHGVSFAPAGWEEGGTQAQASSGPTDETQNAVVIAGHELVALGAYQLNVPIAADNPSPCR